MDVAFLADLPPDLFALPVAPPPAEEPGAKPPEAPPPGVGGPDPLADLPDLGARFRWRAEHVKPILSGPVNALHRRVGLTELDAGEVASGAEVLAPVLSEWLSSVDPNSPAGALSLWLALTYGPRMLDRYNARRALAAGSLVVEEMDAPPPPSPGVSSLADRIARKAGAR